MARGLTAKQVENARAESDRREMPDHGKPGLYLVIQPSGAKSWAIRYRRLSDKKPRKYTLAGFPDIATARKQAQEVIDRINLGEDPAADKQIAKRTIVERESDEFADVAVRFIKRDQRPKKRTWRETARILGLEEADSGELQTIRGGLVDQWKGRRIGEVTKKEILALLDEIVDRDAGIMANRTLAVIRRLFNWCLERDIVQASPCAGIKPPTEETSRDRVLDDDEIRSFWAACDEMKYPFGHAYKLLLLTGQRRSEVGGMCFDEIKDGVWTIPSSRTKNKDAHEVPLSAAALGTIAAVTAIKGKFVFTTTGDAAVSGWSDAKERMDEIMKIAPWRTHDLRRTVATRMQKLGVRLEVTEKCLNHTSGSFSGIVGVYQLHSFAEEKREAFDLWASELEGILAGRPEELRRLRRKRA